MVMFIKSIAEKFICLITLEMPSNQPSRTLAPRIGQSTELVTVLGNGENNTEADSLEACSGIDGQLDNEGLEPQLG